MAIKFHQGIVNMVMGFCISCSFGYFELFYLFQKEFSNSLFLCWFGNLFNESSCCKFFVLRFEFNNLFIKLFGFI